MNNEDQVTKKIKPTTPDKPQAPSSKNEAVEQNDAPKKTKKRIVGPPRCYSPHPPRCSLSTCETKVNADASKVKQAKSKAVTASSSGKFKKSSPAPASKSKDAGKTSDDTATNTSINPANPDLVTAASSWTTGNANAPVTNETEKSFTVGTSKDPPSHQMIKDRASNHILTYCSKDKPSLTAQDSVHADRFLMPHSKEDPANSCAPKVEEHSSMETIRNAEDAPHMTDLNITIAGDGLVKDIAEVSPSIDALIAGDAMTTQIVGRKLSTENTSATTSTNTGEHVTESTIDTHSLKESQPSANVDGSVSIVKSDETTTTKSKTKASFLPVGKKLREISSRDQKKVRSSSAAADNSPINKKSPTTEARSQDLSTGSEKITKKLSTMKSETKPQITSLSGSSTGESAQRILSPVRRSGKSSQVSGEIGSSVVTPDELITRNCLSCSSTAPTVNTHTQYDAITEAAINSSTIKSSNDKSSVAVNVHAVEHTTISDLLAESDHDLNGHKSNDDHSESLTASCTGQLTNEVKESPDNFQFRDEKTADAATSYAAIDTTIYPESFPSCGCSCNKLSSSDGSQSELPTKEPETTSQCIAFTETIDLDQSEIVKLSEATIVQSTSGADDEVKSSSNLVLNKDAMISVHSSSDAIIVESPSSPTTEKPAQHPSTSLQTVSHSIKPRASNLKKPTLIKAMRLTSADGNKTKPLSDPKDSSTTDDKTKSQNDKKTDEIGKSKTAEQCNVKKAKVDSRKDEDVTLSSMKREASP